MSEPRFFRRRQDFRRWLEKHHATETELLVGFHKVGSGLAGMPLPEAVEEALCFGWIDGHLRRIDETSFQVRFTPRRPGSIWSAVNLRRAERLEQDGKMTDAGRAVWQGRDTRRAGLYSFEQPREAALSDELREALDASPTARAFFDAQVPSYRKTATFWVMSAKQEATRARRMASLIESSEAGQFAPPFRFGGAKPKPAGR